MDRRNSDGDWYKAEKFGKEYVAHAKELEETMRKLVTISSKMEDIAVKAYSSAEVVDALFRDSPLGHQKLWHSIECQFKKLGCAPLSRGIFTPSIDIKNVSDSAAEAIVWLMKLRSKKNEKAV